MRIAVLSINIGEYIVFWNGFYNSSEKNFFPDCEKEYFVFTDKTDDVRFIKSNVHVIHAEDEGWPLNSMHRFKLFWSIESKLDSFDYIFFGNANAVFCRRIDEGILCSNKAIITVEHPGRHGDEPSTIPWERRRESNAFVSIDDGKVYVQGAFFGGKKDAFLTMCQELNEKTEEDLSKGIVAVVHDESFLNMYIIGRSDVQILGWQYLKYEEFVYPYVSVIMLRNKRKSISNKNGRFVNQNYLLSDILQFLRNVKWALMIKFRIIKWVDYIDKEGRFVGTDISEDRGMC